MARLDDVRKQHQEEKRQTPNLVRPLMNRSSPTPEWRDIFSNPVAAPSIPGHSAVAIAAIETTPASYWWYTATQPTQANLPWGRSGITMPTPDPVAAGESGRLVTVWPALVTVVGSPAVGDEVGTQAGSFALHTGKTGYTIVQVVAGQYWVRPTTGSGGGSEGPQGIPGAQGPAGNNGASGAQGSAGPQGYEGFQGYDGYQGAQGWQGLGAQGSQGNQGNQGNQGWQNAVGVQGPQGGAGAGGGFTACDLMWGNVQTSDDSWHQFGENMSGNAALVTLIVNSFPAATMYIADLDTRLYPLTFEVPGSDEQLFNVVIPLSSQRFYYKFSPAPIVATIGVREHGYW